jgi:hypothetical protein
MTFRRSMPALLLAAISLAIAAPLASADGITVAERKTMLDMHNIYRAQHCVPPLTWSNELAAQAQKWAEGCWIGHDKKRGHIGENIAWGGDRSASSAVEAWYEEVKEYNYAKPGFASATAHFTQLVWKDTKELGCAAAKCYLGTVRLWVCRYGPTGNWRGKYPQNVPQRCK